MPLLLLLLLIATGTQMSAASFTSVPTSFGSDTALRDDSTGLLWLDLTLTNNRSFNDVMLNLGSGSIYSGWRFATPEELAAFFFNYSEGVTNDALALGLMNDLGGPLQDIFNPANGFHRQSSVGFLDVPFGLGHGLYGYIAVDNFFGPSINSSLYGSTLDDFAFSGTGSWLVQESVPEPGTWMLSLSALVGIGFVILRKRAKHRATV